MIGVLAHLDVVDAEGDWTVDPFEGRVIDGWIWGRGAVDDKGPLIAALYAMQAVKNLHLPFLKKVQMIIGTQEEVAWTDLEDYIINHKVPDYGFTPDGEFPVTNREKDMLIFGLILVKKREKQRRKRKILKLYLWMQEIRLILYLQKR